MEKNKINIAFAFGVFSIFFLSAVMLLIANFISRSLTIIAISNTNYMIDVPIIDEPILFGISVICFIVSIIALVKSALLLKEQ